MSKKSKKNAMGSGVKWLSWMLMSIIWSSSGIARAGGPGTTTERRLDEEPGSVDGDDMMEFVDHLQILVPEIPPEKVFVVQDDTCGKYWTPRTQENPLIYDYELVYTADANGRMVAKYRYLPRLKLPVYCQFCQEMLDVLGGEDSPNQVSSIYENDPDQARAAAILNHSAQNAGADIVSDGLDREE